MLICLVIPCYNEEKRLDQKTFLRFFESHKHIHFLFVNDGSSDNTQLVIEKFSEEFEHINYLSLTKNSGKAEAVRQGFLTLIDQEKYTNIGYWDADLATPLNQIQHFEATLKEHPYDLVMGSRILRLGGNIKRKPQRHILGRIFATIASMGLKIPVYDTQCGAKVFSSQIAKGIFKDAFISYWIFDVELLFRIKRTYSSQNHMLQKLFELPLTAWQDIEGSKLSFFDFLKAPLELLKIYRRYR